MRSSQREIRSAGCAEQIATASKRSYLGGWRTSTPPIHYQYTTSTLQYTISTLPVHYQYRKNGKADAYHEKTPAVLAVDRPVGERDNRRAPQNGPLTDHLPQEIPLSRSATERWKTAERTNPAYVNEEVDTIILQKKVLNRSVLAAG
jgi:hypothetical protein